MYEKSQSVHKIQLRVAINEVRISKLISTVLLVKRRFCKGGISVFDPSDTPLWTNIDYNWRKFTLKQVWSFKNKLQNYYKESYGLIYKVSEVKLMRKVEDIIDTRNNRIIKKNNFFLT